MSAEASEPATVDRERGSAVAEFAMVGALLVVLFLGAFQVGFALLVRNSLTAYAVDGARYGARADSSPAAGAARTRTLIDQGLGGDIVYISSKNSVFAGPNNIAYSATKGGLDAATRSLAREMHGRFLVNSIAPGFFASEMSSVLGTEQLSTITRRTPTNRLVEPENITPTLRMLLFEDTNINGMVLTIDGGGSI